MSYMDNDAQTPCNSNDGLPLTAIDTGDGEGPVDFTVIPCRTEVAIPVDPPPEEVEKPVDNDDETIKEIYPCNFDKSNPPEGAVKLDLEYDYELHWVQQSTVSALGLLSSLEGRMLDDLAEKTGLFVCESRRVAKKTRRTLRADPSRRLENDSILALESTPKDESTASTYECEVEVDLNEDATCTPFHGYMTAWLAPDSDRLESERQILAYVEAGMKDDTYASGAVKKLSYIGSRDSDPPLDIDASNGNEDPTKILEPSKDPSMLAIGISVFVMALAFGVLISFILRRNKNKEENEDEEQRASQEATESEIPGIPDDIELLPVEEKMDMRGIEQEGVSSVSTADDSAGEAHTMDENVAPSHL